MASVNGKHSENEFPDEWIAKEKDPRWNEMAICEPIIREAMEWLEEERYWKGTMPPHFEECKSQIEFQIAEAVFKAFNAGIEEVQALCRALVMGTDEEEYPEKYLPR